jgi:hypothetical protein
MSDSDESDLGRAPRRGGRKTGVPNYQNSILISIVERLLPNGNEGWRLVALAYKEESGEENLRSEDDLKKNWLRKLCNNMKKPTGRMGADAKDRINRCMAIERRILDKSSSGILGGSVEDELNPSSPLSSDDEDGEYKQPESSDEEEAEEEEVPGTEVQPTDFATTPTQPPPVPALPLIDMADFTDCNANAAGAISDAVANTAASKTTTGSGKRWKSRSTGKSNKTKNSTNRERGSVTKSIERIASSIADGKNEDLQKFMMMRKMEWDEAEERRRQEREEARREREEARREREEMEDRRDRRLELQMQQQTQNMQMMMMMMMGAGAMGATARNSASIPTMHAANAEEKNNDNENDT